MLEAQDRLSTDHKIEERMINPLQSEASAELSSPPNNSGDTTTKSIFTADDGVSKAQLQHAEDIFNALPASMQKALRDAHVNMELATGWQNGQPEGANGHGPDGTSIGYYYVDSGMADQSLVHELYEMAGRVSPTTLKGSWNDADAVNIADNDTAKILQGEGVNPRNLHDTLSTISFPNGYHDDKTVPGDGDLMSDAFVADFFVTHPSLFQDTWGGTPMMATIQDAPDLVDNIAKAQGLTSANGQSSLPYHFD